ncbi:MAG: 3-dehydroquinate synthase [Deltaproteobacteria bacterium]|nr:3-dehydroquinate synthase [Deltaproteobacteria bacterium]
MTESPRSIVQRVPLVIEYEVVFTRDVFDPSSTVLVDVLSAREPDRRHRVVIVLDGGVAAAWPALIPAIENYGRHHAQRIEIASIWTVPGGEAAKEAGVFDDIVNRLAALQIDRHSFVVAIGGGAVLDVAGYAAAIVHRGVRLVRIPTTVLAQNDAGVGVKNGINAFGAKNFLGTFAAPFAVIDDSTFLTTLDPRDRAAGMAEAVKVAAIRDPVFFDWLVEHAAALAAFDIPAVERMIRRCAELHLAHIAGGGDPFETGNARPLDFGHWSAHKLEILTSHELRHGEAVAIGMTLDARYSVETGLLDEDSFATFVGLLEQLRLPTWHPALLDPALLGGLDEFRQHLGGELTLTMLAGVGNGVDCRDVQTAIVARSIAWMQQRSSRA